MIRIIYKQTEKLNREHVAVKTGPYFKLCKRETSILYLLFSYFAKYINE